jgi:hypothetical protein
LVGFASSRASLSVTLHKAGFSSAAERSAARECWVRTA